MLMSWDHVLKSWILLLKSDSYKTEEYNFEYKSGLKDLTFQTGMSKTDMFSCLLFFTTQNDVVSHILSRF